MSEQRNLILAVGLSLAILLGFNYFYERPKVAELSHQVEKTQINKQSLPAKQPEESAVLAEKIARSDAVNSTSRIVISTTKLHGSINLKGGRLDDLTLADYRETTDQN